MPMTMMLPLDLPPQPDVPVLPGLHQREDFILRSEERALIAGVKDAGLTPFLFQQWTGKRLTKSFGWSYDFQTGVFAPAEPIPQWAVPLKARAARFAGLEPDELEQLLLIRYDPGAGIGWHRDRPAFEHVIVRWANRRPCASDAARRQASAEQMRRSRRAPSTI